MSSSLNIDSGQLNARSAAGTISELSDDSRSQMNRHVFWVAVILVVAASIYDAFLVYHYRLAIEEQNPLCAWLISLEPDHVSVFLLGKGLGTILVATVLVSLFRFWKPVATPVALALVLFQAGLMVYLHGTDGRNSLTPRQELALAHDQQSPWSRKESNLVETSHRRGRRARNKRSYQGYVQQPNNRANSTRQWKRRPVRDRASGNAQGPLVNVEGR